MPRLRNPIVALAAVAMLAAASVMGATSAFAHAEPSSVAPAVGAILNTAPTQVSMETVEEMTLVAGSNDLVVTGPGGVVSQNPATVDTADHSHISVQLQSNLATGIYTVTWNTVSGDDGDAASGTWTFTYDPSKPASAGSTAPPTAEPDQPAGATTTAGTGSPVAATPPAAPAVGSGGPAAGGGSSTAVHVAEAGAALALFAVMLGLVAMQRRNSHPGN
ncbi:MAG: copper resistance CopC family protein [Tepidiformaceae bacterium]